MEFSSITLQPGAVLVSPERTYTVRSVLGRGGFGITYLATSRHCIGNIEFELKFAVKEFFPEVFCTRNADGTVAYSAAPQVAGLRKAFTAEARRLEQSAFTHPNVVKINEVFESNGTVYYVMEYLEGPTLEQYVAARSRLTASETFDMMLPLVDAVARLHGAHLTHYDIKPANIIVTERGSRQRPVLIDFGLSKHYDDAGHATSAVLAAGYSDGYAPVEQYGGLSDFTPQSDVYALAATYFYCLTGHAPQRASMFCADDLPDLLEGLATPHVIKSLRHAMAMSLRYRPADALKFYNELFEGNTTATVINLAEMDANRPVVKATTPWSEEWNDLDLAIEVDGHDRFISMERWLEIEGTPAAADAKPIGVVVCGADEDFYLRFDSLDYECREDVSDLALLTLREARDTANRYPAIQRIFRHFTNGNYISRIGIDCMHLYLGSDTCKWLDLDLYYGVVKPEPITFQRCAGQSVTLRMHRRKYEDLRKEYYKNYDLVIADSNGCYTFMDLAEYILSGSQFDDNLRPVGMVLTLDSGDIIVGRQVIGPMTWNETARWQRDKNERVFFNPAQVSDIQSKGGFMMDFFEAYGFDNPRARLWTSIKDPQYRHKAYLNPIKNWADDSEKHYVRRIIPMPAHLKRFEYPQ